jgi:carbamoyltransferase
MAAVLGVSCGYHDAAAALVVDGVIVAALQEERLSRVKNDPSLPIRAIAACMEMAEIDRGGLDEVVFYESPYAKLERILVSSLRTFPRSLRQFPRALASQLGDKLWVLDGLAKATGTPRGRVSFVAHHESHAASAFFTSPYARAAVLTVDGVGESTSTAIFLGEGDTLKALETIAYPHSLGLLYAGITAYLGFEVNEGEHKVMGLAAYGAPRLRDRFERIVQLADDGSFTLGLPYFGYHADPRRAFSSKLLDLLGPARSPGRPWDLASSGDRHYADVAATLQAVTEDALLALARRARERTGASNLCLAGGVALNAVANAALASQAGFDRIYVQPAAGDAGGALGAALLGAVRRGELRATTPFRADLGIAADPARALDVGRAMGLSVERCAEPAEEIAARIVRGEVVAVVSGRSEWGPRALGHRSILADPTSPSTRERINRAVKHREPFRPFAPCVLADRASSFFEGAPSDMTPFMTTVCNVIGDALGAVTHVDGTARVQTVHHPSMLQGVLESLARQGRPPIALNTSLNGRGEPICAAVEDALGFFLSHPVDALFVEDVRIERAS